MVRNLKMTQIGFALTGPPLDCWVWSFSLGKGPPAKKSLPQRFAETCAFLISKPRDLAFYIGKGPPGGKKTPTSKEIVYLYIIKCVFLRNT